MRAAFCDLDAVTAVSVAFNTFVHAFTDAFTHALAAFHAPNVTSHPTSRISDTPHVTPLIHLSDTLSVLPFKSLPFHATPISYAPHANGTIEAAKSAASSAVCIETIPCCKTSDHALNISPARPTFSIIFPHLAFTLSMNLLAPPFILTSLSTVENCL